MTQVVTRIYGTHENATGAVNELKKNRFAVEEIHVVAPPGGDASIDSIAATIMKTYIAKKEALIYAEAVKKGGTMVSVHAPFGTAAAAIEILESFHPIASGVSDEESSMMTWDDAAPLSSAFQMPLLSENATPFSAFWNLPLLTSDPAPLSSALKTPELVSDDSTFSGMIGMPLLVDNPTIISSLLHMPVLTKS